MQTALSETELAFLRFVRVVMYGIDAAEEEDRTVKLTQEEWGGLFRLAQQHHLLGAVYDTVGCLGKQQELPQQLKQSVRHMAMKEMMGQTMRTGQLCRDYRELEKNGVFPLMIKGIMCRCLYPKPDLRPSGDEDMLIRRIDFAAADAFFMSRGFQRDKEIKEGEIPEEMGYIHPGNGAFYEVHTCLFANDSAAYGYLNRAFGDAFDRAVSEKAEGVDFHTLEYGQHLFYLLCHSFKHFLHGGVGIRQICDMVLFINAHGTQIDWNRFRNQCEEYGIACFCANLLDIGEKYLGFSYEKAGAARLTEPVDSGELLQDILDGGVFGKTSAGRVHSANITLSAAAGRTDSGHRLGGIWKSLFPSAEYIMGKYPYARRCRLLLPVAYLNRMAAYCREQRRRKEEKSSIEVGAERVALLKKYKMVRGEEPKKET